MHHASAPTDLVTIRAAAKAYGISHSTISRKVKAGLIPSYDGQVSLAEVGAHLAQSSPATDKKTAGADGGAQGGAPRGAEQAGAPQRAPRGAPPVNAPPVAGDDLITVRACAKLLTPPISHTTLLRQIESGAIRSHPGGKVRLIEVLEDRAKNIDLSKSKGKRKKGASPAADDGAGAELGQQLEMVEVDGQLLSFADAQKLKENYIARKHHLDYLAKCRAVVDRRAAEDAFFALARQIRDAWTTWAPRISTLLAAELNTDAALLSEALSRHVHQHLSELGEPKSPAALAGEPANALAKDGQPDAGVAVRSDAGGEDNSRPVGGPE
jgi:hypothetical protein